MSIGKTHFYIYSTNIFVKNNQKRLFHAYAVRIMLFVDKNGNHYEQSNTKCVESALYPKMLFLFSINKKCAFAMFSCHFCVFKTKNQPFCFFSIRTTEE